jgi:translation elongation factor EF-Tu-like GTPase
LAIVAKPGGKKASKKMSAKACIHVGIIGHPQHGKSTLTRALMTVSKAIYCAGSVKVLDEAPPTSTDGIRVSGWEVVYESLSRRYVHLDFASLADLLKALVLSAQALDGVILVVDAATGVEPETTEQLALTKAAGITCAAAYITKVDAVDPVLVEATELETRELLAQREASSTPVLRGSARQALEAAEQGQLRHPDVRGIRRLVQALDDHLTVHAAPHAHDESPASIIRSSRIAAA